MTHGKSTARIDATIRGSLKQLTGDIDGLFNTISTFESNPESYNLTAKEVERRRNLVSNLKNSVDAARAKFENHSKAGAGGEDLTRAKFQEQYDVQNMSNQQLIGTTKDLIKKQDQHIDTLAGTVSNLKGIGRNIGEELDLHNKLLTDLDAGVDKNTQKMEKTQGRLQDFMKKTNTNCLYIIILVEVLILILLLAI
eukprot:TRINITY_DN5715_c0_g2_i1.p1 TRINITY_DN5715_c0_g2~~TRINITY_DN5715_c0_g2_i1.p1  ORF type:complete len:196 (-),score=52.50 TRINITY_DN5715_c0_g2_i1:185-772(-)